MRRPLSILALFVAAATTSDAFAKDAKQVPIEVQFDIQYTSDDAAARAKAVDSLKSAPDPLKLSILAAKVIGKEKRADVVARAAEVVSSIKDEKVIAGVVAGAKSGPEESRIVYVEAMASMAASNAAHQTLLDLVKDKSVYIRGMAAVSLGEHRSMDALAPLLLLLDDKAWMVQAAALSAIPRLSDKAALKNVVGKLVEFMENVSGRMRVDCSEALRRITGKSLGVEAPPWRKWYDSGMIDEAKPESDGDKPEPPRSAYAEEKPHFYGMTVTSNRVLIVLDVSLSMYDAIEIDKDRLRRETSRRVVTGEKKPEDKEPDDQGFDIPWWKVKTRLDLAKYQTINLVSQLREGQTFEIITFSKNVTPWMGKIVPATAANKQKAITLLETITPEDATNTWGALAAAFDMIDVNKKGDAFGPDEMYFVTDGAPSVGDIKDPNQILEAVLQLHKMKPLKINVIGIGVDLSFLRKMARDTGGQSKFFK